MKKVFKLSILYIFVTLLTTVGTVFLAKFTSSSNNTDSSTFETSSSIEQLTAIDNMLEGIMNATGLDIAIDAQVLSEDSEAINVLAQVYLDLSNGFDALAVQGNVTVNENLSLDIIYKNDWLYLSMFGQQLKIQTSKLTDIVKIVTGLFTTEADTIQTEETVNSNSALANLDISQIMANLQTMKDEPNEFGHMLSGNLLGVDFNILTDENYKISEVTTKPICIDKFTILPHVTISYLEQAKEIAVEEDAYVDLSTADKLVNAIVNTAKLTDFHITTNLKVDMQISAINKNITMDIPVDAKIKIVDKQPQIMAQIGPIPVIAPVNNDAPYVFGDTVDGLYCGLNRILTVYYANGYVYFYRTEEIPVFASKNRTYEKMYKLTLEEFLQDPLMILSYGCGFQDIIMNEITKSMELANNRQNPIDINNVLVDFDWDGKDLSLVLNLKELTNSDKMGNLNLTISTGDVGGKDYITGGALTVSMPITDGFKIDLKTTDLVLNNPGQTLDWMDVENFINQYPYKTDEKWEANSGKWSLVSATTYTVNFVTNCEEEITPIIDVVNTEFELPTLATRVEDDNVTKTTYTFGGWYTSATFEENTKVLKGKIPRGDTTLYAKWNVDVKFYRDMTVVNKLLKTNVKYRALEGTQLDFPITFDNYVDSTESKTTTYQFIGWYQDEDYNTPWFGGNIVPKFDVTIYAKWKVIEVKETKLLNIYDNGVCVSSLGFEVGKAIDLTGAKVKIDKHTKWYTDANYLQETTLPNIMPNQELNVHIRNLYTVTIVDSTFDNKMVTLTGYQGEKIALPNDYATVVLDDGTKTKQETYTFSGFDKNLTVFPNVDTTIEVVWDIDVKYYYNVTFNTETKVLGGFYNEIVFNTENLRVLEGSVVDLSKYSATWSYNFIGKWHHNFEGWILSIDNKSDAVTSIIVTADTTIYAKWSDLKPGLN